MNGRFVVRLLLVLALVAGLAILGAGVYQAGFAAGLVAAEAAVPGVVAYPAWGWGPGFGIFGLLGFLLFLFLFFGLVRAAFFGFGGRGRGGHGPGGWGHAHWGPPRDAFEDWHRRAHEPGAGSEARDPTAS